MKANYIIGIDLGTTNSVVAYKKKGDDTPISIFGILQLTKEGHVEAKNTLPSFIYIPGEHDMNKKHIALPWNKNMDYCCGELARKQGNKVPQRMISSAKSWLSHRQVDRLSALLPLEAPEDIEKISPVEASTRYLQHIKESWNHFFSKEKNATFEEQEILLTVPASFDAVARELTVTAAKNAGITVTLLEEPQAAFYSWLHNEGENWREQLNIGDTAMVIDVGGGTSDFCLVKVESENGNLTLRRIAVGNHILLGGDNMDLTLAHLISSKLPKANLDPWQSLSLWYSCCEAKEKLFENAKLDSTPVAILGRSSSIIGGTLKAKLLREELEKTLIDGFFPKVNYQEDSKEIRKAGLSQLGLPYASEPAITKHIAQFLKQNKDNDVDMFPSAILFNGGVFKAKAFQDQVVSVMESWTSQKVKVLGNMDLDLAVATGAVYYGLTKHGEGIRIKGGIARSYYLGVETSAPAIPGIKPPIKALCVIPSGMEEGSECDVPDVELGLTIGEPVVFPFYTTNNRKEDEVGNSFAVNEDLAESSSLETTLAVNDGIEEGETIPVKLHSRITEVGTLEISCRSQDNKNSWILEFNVREKKE